MTQFFSNKRDASHLSTHLKNALLPHDSPNGVFSAHSSHDDGSGECRVNVFYSGWGFCLISLKLTVLIDGVVVGNGDMRHGFDIDAIIKPGQHTITVKTLFMNESMQLELKNAGDYKVRIDCESNGCTQDWWIKEVLAR